MEMHINNPRLKYIIINAIQCPILTFNLFFKKENDCVHNLINAMMPHHRRRDFITLCSKSPQRNHNEIKSLTIWYRSVLLNMLQVVRDYNPYDSCKML